MLYPTKILQLHPRDKEHVKRLNDPAEPGLFHLETWLPFSEAAKLDRGNANVRPASERKKPFKDMVETVEKSPSTFHRKNRGIIYVCERFEWDNSQGVIRVTVPDLPAVDLEEADNEAPKFGIADGGHTFSVIQQTIARAHELSEGEGWKEPFVRIHFLAGRSDGGELEQVVEALNTSSQVQQYTIDEYLNKFESLKEALRAGGFDPEFVAFRENEDKEWEVRELIQRLACFLKDRWKSTQPSSMYKSKGAALDLYTSDKTGEEFKKLNKVAADVITLPEFIQSEFSKGDSVKGRKFGKLRAVKTLKKPRTPIGTTYTTDHEMDLAASLPIAAAFRELLELHGTEYYWRFDFKEVFRLTAEELYKVLLNKLKTAKSVNSLGADTEYWTQCSNIVLRAKSDLISQKP